MQLTGFMTKIQQVLCMLQDILWMFMQGWRYIPFGAAAGKRQRLGREQPGAKSSKSTRNNHPATAKDFSQASFSQRFVTSFKHLAEQYVLVLDVTGKGDRNNSWPCLSRQGEQYAAFARVLASHTAEHDAACGHTDPP